MLFQYPAVAHPLATDVALVVPDLHPVGPTDVMRRRMPVIEGGPFAPPLTGEETVKPDKFGPSAELPTRRRFLYPLGGEVHPLEPYPAIPVDDWRRESSRPQNPVRRTALGWVAGPVAIQFPVLDTIGWYREAQRPQNPVRRNLPGWSVRPLDPSLVVDQSLAWLRDSERPRATVRQCREGVSGRPLEPSLIVDTDLGWYVLPSRPRNPIPPRQHQSLAEPVEPSVRVEQALAWLRDSERPRNPIPSRLHAHVPHAAPLEPALIIEQALAWLAGSPGPVRRVRLTPEGASVVQVVADLLAFAWLRDSERPVKARRPAVPLGQATPEPSPVQLPIGWEWVSAFIRQPARVLPGLYPTDTPGPVSPVSTELRIDNRNVTGRATATISVSGG